MSLETRTCGPVEDVRHGGRCAWSPPDGDDVITRSVMSTMTVGDELHALVARLYPICRSLTGPGVRQTLAILQERLPLEIHEVSTGTRAFDWTVPQEWRIHDAYIKDAHGVRLIDFRKSNLHVVNYSVGIARRMPWRELKEHLHTLPDRPDWIPYRTSYYQPTWGFCIAYCDWLEFERRGDDAEYEVLIDAEHCDGSLSYGEYYLPGETTDEVLFSCHVCHPSLANDNLSGVAVATFLAQHLSQAPRRYSYRFLFVPATIGPLVWLSRHQQSLDRIKHGLVLTLLGDRGKLTYKRSRRGDAGIDRAVEHVLAHSPGGHRLLGFAPLGYDERQYCSPGFNLPIGCLMRTPHGEFAEYHTSADNLDFVNPASLADSLATCISIVDVLERDRTYFNRHPYGEPQLGRRGLYATVGGKADRGDLERAILWMLNLSDGEHSLLEIARRSGLPFATITQAGDLLLRHHLIREVAPALVAGSSLTSPEQSGTGPAATLSHSIPTIEANTRC